MASCCCAGKFSAESINEWRAGAHVNCTTPLALYSLFEGTEEDRIDPSNANQKQITVAHEIRKIFLVFFVMCPSSLLSISFRVWKLKSHLFQFFSVQGVHGMSMVCGGRFQITKPSIACFRLWDTAQWTRTCESPLQCSWMCWWQILARMLHSC